VTFLTLFLSSLAGWIAFALDLALVLVARNRINDYTEDVFSGHIGNAVWLALAGAVSPRLAGRRLEVGAHSQIVLTGSICLAGCGMFGRYSHRREATASSATPKPYRRRFP
jgi:hypothetical protein